MYAALQTMLCLALKQITAVTKYRYLFSSVEEDLFVGGGARRLPFGQFALLLYTSNTRAISNVVATRVQYPSQVLQLQYLILVGTGTKYQEVSWMLSEGGCCLHPYSSSTV